MPTLLIERDNIVRIWMILAIYFNVTYSKVIESVSAEKDRSRIKDFANIVINN